MGDWTHDFDGKGFDGSTLLPREMMLLAEPKAAADHIIKQLRTAGVAPQARADRTIVFGDCRSIAPPAKGECRLLDGTHIIVSGAGAASGDLIQRTISVRDHPVAVDAVGLVGVRLDKQGRIEALAAGGLKSLDAGDLRIELPARVDLALWRDGRGQFRGVLQDCPGPVPAPLGKLTDDWLRLSVPAPLE